MLHSEFGFYIIAGGKSSRMGSDKARLQFGGLTLIERAVRLGQSFSDQVGIVGNRPDLAVYGRVIPDVYSDVGPLGGIHAALKDSQRTWIFALAVDMPFVTPGLLDFIATTAETANMPACVCEVGGRVQPLCAAYRRTFLPSAEHHLQAGVYRIGAALDACGYQVIESDDLHQGGFDPSFFRNINTPEDLAIAQSSVVSEEP